MSPKTKEKDKDQDTRVDHLQYDEPLATASTNTLVPRAHQKVFCDCGECEYWCLRLCEMPSED
jgi:hypothetical protein